MSQRCKLPPSSSGLGRSPFKATTGVRIPVGAQKSDKASQNSKNVEEFLAGLRFEQRGKLNMVHSLSGEIIARHQFDCRGSRLGTDHKTDKPVAIATVLGAVRRADLVGALDRAGHSSTAVHGYISSSAIEVDRSR